MDIFQEAKIQAKQEVECKTGLTIPEKPAKKKIHSEKESVWKVEFA
jgi:hypothetical protein